jgi:hypothetical protein
VRRRILVGVAALVMVAVVPVGLQAAPTCTTDTPEAGGVNPGQVPCGGRVVAEPETTATFVQYGTELKPALDAIAKISPTAVEVSSIDQLTGNPAYVSAGARKLWVVRVTDETVPAAGKKQMVASLSIHANEAAGREGGIRYVEDLARWFKSDKQHKVYAGDVSVTVDRLLRETELYFVFTNPDGWADGDIGNGGVFKRANDNGYDLNRQFPTVGWTKTSNNQMSQPEAKGLVAWVESLPNLTTATDIHGELTSATNSFADMMWPAGEWTPREQAQELQLAQHMTRTIQRKFDEYVVAAERAGRPLPDNPARIKPANFATAYDIVGYDDSGFLGDWFVGQNAIEIDIENFLSHTVPSNIWLAGLEQGHIAAVRGILEAISVEALLTEDVKPQLNLGRVAYVSDPVPVSSNDDNGMGTEVPGSIEYSANRMQYFDDLASDAGVPVTAIASGDVATTDLSKFDTIVIADNKRPVDVNGRAVDAAAYTVALDRFANEGGQLLLTDKAVDLLVDMGLATAADVKTVKTNAGHIDFGTRDHAWEAGLVGVPSQTYYEVPLGYTATNNAPHWGIDSAKWSALGGKTVGTVGTGAAAFTALGEVRRGAGSIAIFGAILPTQTEANPHQHGLANYAVTVAGGEVLHTMLEYRRPAIVGVPPTGG